MTDPVTVVWFKRDLRIEDHVPLFSAAQQGRVIPLYIAEPSVLRAPDASALHAGFIRESLRELAEGLARLGAPLWICTGDAVEVLEQVRRATGFTRMHSHMETGTDLTFRRDRAVAAWARTHGIVWEESPPFGVRRGRVDRNGWQSAWESFMARPCIPAPDVLRPFSREPVPRVGQEGLEIFQRLDIPSRVAAEVRQVPDVQGGTVAGRAWFEEFLDGRGAGYSRAMSSPVTAYRGCSRLSPYLAWGCLSMRSVVQRLRKARSVPGPVRPGDLRSLDARLHWHCHFIQKLEAEPAIEFRCFNRACEALRSPGAHPERLRAWQEGRTGYPFVDACMRSLQARGWINFRMRAMLVSFAAYDLWLDWRDLRDFLAAQFIDYEPGIHISQLQMQSGTTGINTLRMYNPVKQGLDHDPSGDFIRQWVPELREVDGPSVHQPWRSGIRVADYPSPIVDHAVAVREARAAFSALRRSPDHRAEAARVFQEHGSRKRPSRARRAKRVDASQLLLPGTVPKVNT